VIAATLVILLAGAPKIELGGMVGQGHVFGNADPALGRSDDAVSPAQDPWTFGGWCAYQWRRGHDLGVRVQSWRAEHDAVGMDDLGGGTETIQIDLLGLEYTRLIPYGKYQSLRMGGGLGFAQASDEFRFSEGSITASGDGMAGWLRAGVATPMGAAATLHVTLAGVYAGFSKMKSNEMESFDTNYWILEAELGLSFGI